MRVYKIALLTILFLLLVASSASAWQVNQHYKNNTGQNAYDLTKFIFGPDIVFTDMMVNQPFPDTTQVPFGSFTVGHWYDLADVAFVAPGDYGHACFATNAKTAPPYCAYWTDASGNFIGRAGPVMDAHIRYVFKKLYFKLSNLWRRWTGAGYPPLAGDNIAEPIGEIDVLDAMYAVDSVGRVFDLEDLDNTLLGQYTFNDLPGLEGVVDTLLDVTAIVEDIALQDGYTVLLYFSMIGPAGEEAYDVIAWEVEQERVPATTNWGLAILLILLIGTSIYLYKRRSRLVT